jgi:hypothetical protein
MVSAPSVLPGTESLIVSVVEIAAADLRGMP